MPQKSKGVYDLGEVSADMGLLYPEAAHNQKYMELECKDYLKSRMP